LKTLILKSDNENISGFIEYSETNAGIEICYNIKDTFLPDGFLKLYILSSAKPFNKPIIADTLEFKSQVATGKRSLSYSYLTEYGLHKSEADTFAIVKTDSIGNPDSVEAVCFVNSEWNVKSALKNTVICQNENPAERGERIIESIKERTKTTDPKAQQLWIDKLLKSAVSMKKSNISPIEGYNWYICEDMRPPLPLSAYRHLLFVTEVMTAFDKEGYYLFGIKDDGHTAISIKASRNPFVNANDCAVKTGDFFTAGVFLAPDGQYFERIET